MTLLKSWYLNTSAVAGAITAKAVSAKPIILIFIVASPYLFYSLVLEVDILAGRVYWVALRLEPFN